MTKSKDKDIIPGMSEDDFRQAMSEGLEPLTEALQRRADLLERIGMLMEAREYSSQGDHQKASELYSNLADLDEEKKDRYLRFAKEEQALIYTE